MLVKGMILLLNWLRKLMYGRNGSDTLGFALLLLSAILSVLLAFLPDSLILIRLVCYIPLGLSIYRMFSKNIAKRQLENERFLIWWRNLKSQFNRKKQQMQDSKTYKFLKCPQCGQKLRLPKGRGKIRITCPKCGKQFEKRT